MKWFYLAAAMGEVLETLKLASSFLSILFVTKEPARQRMERRKV